MAHWMHRTTRLHKIYDNILYTANDEDAMKGFAGKSEWIIWKQHGTQHIKVYWPLAAKGFCTISTENSISMRGHLEYRHWTTRATASNWNLQHSWYSAQNTIPLFGLLVIKLQTFEPCLTFFHVHKSYWGTKSTAGGWWDLFTLQQRWCHQLQHNAVTYSSEIETHIYSSNSSSSRSLGSQLLSLEWAQTSACIKGQSKESAVTAQMNLCNGTVLYIEVGCDKLATDHCKYCRLSWTMVQFINSEHLPLSS